MNPLKVVTASQHPEQEQSKMKFDCQYHDIEFIDRDHFSYHTKHDRAQIINRYMRFICAYKGINEKRCQRSFATQTALVIHCKERHNLFVCSECQQTVSSIGGLESHEHSRSTICKYIENELFAYFYFKYFIQKTNFSLISLEATTNRFPRHRH